MTNWKLGSINSPWAQNDLCDRWGQQGFWMWKQCPHCGGLPQRGEKVERQADIFASPPFGADNRLSRVGVHAVNVAIALLPLAGRKEHFPERVENWEFDMTEAKNDFTEWKTIKTNGVEGHRVACDGCGQLSSIEDWDVEPSDIWIPVDGEIIGFVHSDAGESDEGWGAYIYKAVPRKADGKLTWRRLKEHDTNRERCCYGNEPTELCDVLVGADIRVTNRRVMNVSPGSNLRHGEKVRERKELTAELLRSF